MESWKYEFTAFGVENPLKGEKPEQEERYSDLYVHLEQDRSIKIRDQNQLKVKDLASFFLDAERFRSVSFDLNGRNSREDIKQFLKPDGLEKILDGPGIQVDKDRQMYDYGGTFVHYASFSVCGREGKALTISSDNPYSLIKVRSELLLPEEKNLSFAGYLLENDCMPESSFQQRQYETGRILPAGTDDAVSS